MKKETIIEGNILIAKFMGAKVVQREGRPIGDFHGFGPYVDGSIGLQASGSRDHCELVFIRSPYHDSWSWLMPVLGRIEKLGFHTGIATSPAHHVVVFSNEEPFPDNKSMTFTFNTEDNTKLEAVYLSIVAAIRIINIK